MLEIRGIKLFAVPTAILVNLLKYMISVGQRMMVMPFTREIYCFVEKLA